MSHSFCNGLGQVFKAGIFCTLGFSLMGNSSCEKKPVKPIEGRILKKRADLKKIMASAFTVPGNTSFDFEFVANAVLYDVLYQNGHYAVPFAEYSPSPVKLSDSDLQLFQAWSADAGVVPFADFSGEASCLTDIPQMNIAGAVRSFELVNQTGLSVGYGTGGVHTGFGAEVNVNVSTAQLDVGLVGYSPLTNSVFGTGEALPTQTKTDLNLNINFGLFSLGPKFFFQTPLSQVTRKALTMALDQLVLNTKDYEWQTRVLADNDTHIVIQGGKNVGLVVGDQLEIYNEMHRWEGAPCLSKYLGGYPTTSDPITTIEIVHLGDDLSEGKVLQQSDFKVKVGALVKTHKLVVVSASTNGEKP